MKTTVLGFLVFAVMALPVTPGALAKSGEADIGAGRKLAEQACARCHAIGRDDESTLAIAPPLRTFAAKWPLENLEEAFAEGIVTGHAAMPEFQFEPEQINDLLSYIQSVSP